MKVNYPRVISIGLGIALVGFATYMVTVAGLVAPYSLELFTVLFILGISFLSFPFVISEIRNGRLEDRVKKLEI